MPLCISHQEDKVPRYLHYESCDECARVDGYRRRVSARRKGASTHEAHSAGWPRLTWAAHEVMLERERRRAEVQGLPLAPRIKGMP